MWIDPRVNALLSSLWPCQPQCSVAKWTEELWGLSDKSIELWHWPCVCAWMNVGVIAFDFWVTSLTDYSCGQFLWNMWSFVCACSCTFASYLLCVSISQNVGIYTIPALTRMEATGPFWSKGIPLSKNGKKCLSKMLWQKYSIHNLASPVESRLSQIICFKLKILSPCTLPHITLNLSDCFLF